MNMLILWFGGPHCKSCQGQFVCCPISLQTTRLFLAPPVINSKLKQRFLTLFRFQKFFVLLPIFSFRFKAKQNICVFTFFHCTTRLLSAPTTINSSNSFFSSVWALRKYCSVDCFDQKLSLRLLCRVRRLFAKKFVDSKRNEAKPDPFRTLTRKKKLFRFFSLRIVRFQTKQN